MWEPQMLLMMTTINRMIQEMGLEDHEGLDDLESDNSGNVGNSYDQDSDDFDN